MFFLDIMAALNNPTEPFEVETLAYDGFIDIFRSCLASAELRPSAKNLRARFRKLRRGNRNIVDHIIKRIKDYSENLQSDVSEKTEQLLEERHKTDMLLQELFPQ